MTDMSKLTNQLTQNHTQFWLFCCDIADILNALQCSAYDNNMMPDIFQLNIGPLLVRTMTQHTMSNWMSGQTTYVYNNWLDIMSGHYQFLIISTESRLTFCRWMFFIRASSRARCILRLISSKVSSLFRPQDISFIGDSLSAIDERLAGGAWSVVGQEGVKSNDQQFVVAF